MMRIANGKLPWPWIDPDKALPWVEGRIGLALAESQVAAIRLALMSKGPGVGKTTIVNAILRILAAKGTNLLLCAPTGRAAKRMTEAGAGERGRRQPPRACRRCSSRGHLSPHREPDAIFCQAEIVAASHGTPCSCRLQGGFAKWAGGGRRALSAVGIVAQPDHRGRRDEFQFGYGGQQRLASSASPIVTSANVQTFMLQQAVRTCRPPVSKRGEPGIGGKVCASCFVYQAACRRERHSRSIALRATARRPGV